MGNSKSAATPHLLPADTIEPTVKHSATVIFLHGLGDSGTGWCEQFKQHALPHVKYVFPHAPSIPVTVNGGVVMPSWFDVKGLGHEAEEDEAGIKRASRQLASFVKDEERRGLLRERIIIGGFSQGGAVALYTVLTDSKPVAGVLAFSAWLPLHKTILAMAASSGAVSRGIPPVLQCHGTSDSLVPFKWGQMTARALQQLSPAHQLLALQGVAHSSSEEELKAMKSFVMKIFPEM